MNKATKIAMVHSGKKQNGYDPYRSSSDRGPMYDREYHRSEQRPPYHYRDQRDERYMQNDRRNHMEMEDPMYHRDERRMSRLDGKRYEDLNKDVADEWSRRMKNADGSPSPHWTFEQVKQLANQKPELRNINPVELYAVMNMLYSDYCEVAKKFGVAHADFFSLLAAAFIEDDDARDHKVSRYYECIVGD